MENKKINWIIHNVKYLPSYSEYVNYWGRVDDIVIMDNHRCALYHWLSIDRPFHYLHIDAHYDAFCDQNTSEELQLLRDANLKELTFLNLENLRLQKKLVRWDNYIPIFYSLKKDLILSSHFFTQKIGIPPHPPSVWKEHGPWELVSFLQLIQRSQMDEVPWLINIDLDYFFQKDFHDPIFRDEFIVKFFAEINKLRKLNLVMMISIAISPECCPGRDVALKFLNKVMAQLSNDDEILDVLKC